MSAEVEALLAQMDCLDQPDVKWSLQHYRNSIKDAAELIRAQAEEIARLRERVSTAESQKEYLREQIAAAARQEPLTFDAFRQANVSRCLKWHPAGIESWSPSDWLTAVAGEFGELASLLKMRNRERDGLPGNKFSPSNKQVADEIADVLTYLDLLAAALGVNLGNAAVEKFNEVSERVGFPDRLTLYSAPVPAGDAVSVPDVTVTYPAFQAAFEAHPWYKKRIDGTPLENDLAVVADRTMRQLLVRPK